MSWRKCPGGNVLGSTRGKCPVGNCPGGKRPIQSIILIHAHAKQFDIIMYLTCRSPIVCVNIFRSTKQERPQDL